MTKEIDNLATALEGTVQSLEYFDKVDPNFSGKAVRDQRIKTAKEALDAYKKIRLSKPSAAGSAQNKPNFF